MSAYVNRYTFTMFLLLGFFVNSVPSVGFRSTASLKVKPLNGSSIKAGWQPALTSINEVVVDTIYSPIQLISRIIRKPIRDVNFWGKALTIYGSYKVHQVKTKVQSKLVGRRRGLNVNQIQEMCKNKTDEMYNYLHEENSKRMVNLCLGMKGFYLKTGQFLGTRHDFMPEHYTSKLSKLHDDVPPIPGSEVQKILEKELGGPLDNFFTSIDLIAPVGSASVAQVHIGTWRKTGEKVAVKVQYPNAERLMIGDLKNLRALAEFLQKTEFKFDLLSSIKELQKQIVNEFDFRLEANNMDYIRKSLANSVNEVSIPKSIFSTKRALVMTFVDGVNLCKLAEFKTKKRKLSNFVEQKVGRKLLNILAKAYGIMIFELNFFNADPHPGNICLAPTKVGLLDWGQMKRLPDALVYKFARAVEAINNKNRTEIVQCFFALGIKVADPTKFDFVHNIALTMLDTKKVPGFVIDPFSRNSSMRQNTVIAIPSDFYFVIRAVQLMRGIAFAFGIDFSLANVWAPYVRKAITRLESSQQQQQFILAASNLSFHTT